MLILKFLHIVSMFGFVTLALGGAVFLHLVAHARDVHAYRRLDAPIQRTDVVAIALFLAGIIFGLLAAITGGFDLTASWLILAYILVVVIVVHGFLLLNPWYVRLRNAANQPDAAAAVEEFQRLLRTHPVRHMADLVFGTALWVAIIYVMVVKPTLF
jgi:uncharacterized membrane protein